MAYVLAFLGFIALIILHEAGHFTAAKAVGMRVERFSLFFGPLLLKFRRGETEYGVGPIPLGGYVKITGMNPEEELPDEVRPRAYYNQPVWKRVVVIGAGPLVNIVLAFVIVWALLMIYGQTTILPTNQVAQIQKKSAAAAVLRPGDRLISANGVSGSVERIRNQIDSTHCAGPPKNGCVATQPVRIVVRRDGELVSLSARPRYDASLKRMLLGFDFGTKNGPQYYPGATHGVSIAGSYLATVAGDTVSAVARVFEPQERKQLGGVVGGYTVTEESFAKSPERALEVLALISLSLGVINLFPFLPLDGGHIFWAVAEKVRGKRIPFAVMERAGMVGFVLIIALFFIGLSNDISKLSSGGFNIH
jgi:regulator of sigma E protease